MVTGPSHPSGGRCDTCGGRSPGGHQDGHGDQRTRAQPAEDQLCQVPWRALQLPDSGVQRHF